MTHDLKTNLFYFLGFISITLPRLKVRYQIICQSEELFANLDAAKVADLLLIIHPADLNDGYSLNSNERLNHIYNHCLPTTMHVTCCTDVDSGKKRQKARKVIQKAIDEKFSDEKLHLISNASETLQVMQLIANCKKRRVVLRNHRPMIMGESFSYEPETQMMKIRGFIRSNPVDVNNLIHIPGWQDYQINCIKLLPDPKPINIPSHKMETDEVKIYKPDLMKQESLDRENEPDLMDGEQTWPTPEELAASGTEVRKKVIKVPKGTSDYQAAWIAVDPSAELSDDSDSDDESNLNLEAAEADKSLESDKEENEEEYETMTVTEGGDDTEKYDEKLDEDDEKKQLVRFKEARENDMFPDEVDTPQDISARVRFARYRGLKSFIHSPWDPKENLPQDYSRIFNFENFNHTRKRVIKNLKNNENAICPGHYVEIVLEKVPEELYKYFNDKPHHILLLVGLLPYEQKMSLLNVVLRRSPHFEESIKSKEELIFHLGFRRFKARPIFSQHTNGDKFKSERFLPKDGSVVASFYAPITFPPASSLVFKEYKDGSQKLVGTGSLLSVNPDRVVIKRIRLSGHPFKIVKRGAVVRYMFFEREDIKWFKPVELRTKYGRHGHIREALGTHGHMKCAFDKPLAADDTVFMNLYKRVYPKWSFVDCVNDRSKVENMDI